jgi:sugar lactone lactonase YvrE
MDPTPLTRPGPWERITPPHCRMGSSPFWHPLEERLYWLDAGLSRVWRWHLPSGQSEFWQLEQTPGSIAPCRSGALLLAQRDGIFRCENWRDFSFCLAPAPYDTTRMRFEGGKCDLWGRFWVGTCVEDGERRDGGLYCLHQMDRSRLQLVQVAGGVHCSSGLAWSPDGRTQFWNDAARGEVRTFGLSSAGRWPPELGAPLTIRRFPPQPGPGESEAGTPAYIGRPAGAAMDRDGHYWLAMHGGGRVLCLDSEGKVLADIPTPAPRPTALCFGGQDMRTLFLTTERAGCSASELERHPDSGAVFALRLPTPGLTIPFYED